MLVHIQRAALAAALSSSLGGVAFADALNPQPLPPGGPHDIGKLSDGRLAEIDGRILEIGSSHTPALAGRYTLADGSTIVVGPKGLIASSTSALVNRLILPGSKAMLNPQPLPP